MPPELPVDVWLEIVANHIHDKKDVSSLASTNGFLRELLLPSLYRCLTFGGYGVTGFEACLAAVNREHARATALQRCPHLLRHVHEFNIHGWFKLTFASAIRNASSVEGPDAEGQSSWHHDSMADTRVASSAYEAITSLVPQLTSVRKLAFRDCTITPQLHSAFCSISSLDTLSIMNCQLTDGTLIVDMGHITFPLREFTFLPENFLRDGKPYFTRLLQSCTSSLASLCISSECAPQLSAVATSHRLTLHRLTVFVNEMVPDQGQGAAMGHLLISCPELRDLKCIGTIHLDTPPQHALPKLTSVFGSPAILRSLVPQRPVHDIHIRHSQAEPIVCDDFDLYRASTVPIRKVGITSESPLPEDMIARMGHVFRHMTHLLILFIDDEVDNVMEDIADAVVNTLSQWPQLQVCHLREVLSSDPSVLDQDATEEEAVCPIGKRGDPANRGHPSLEELSIFSRFTWLWSPQDGWTCSSSHDEFILSRLYSPSP